MIPYFVITAGYSGLMARFNDDGRLIEWTPFLGDASLFATADAGNAAIQSICAPEYAKAIASGRAERVRVVDEDGEPTGEVVIMNTRGGRMRTPALGRTNAPRTLDADAREGPASIRGEVRREMRQSTRNPTRQTEARIHPATNAGTEYTTPGSARSRRAHAYGHL